MVTSDSNAPDMARPEAGRSSRPEEWVLLLHRLPREPSAPRIALWRAIRRLGAVLLGDGLVALPASERNTEHFEWLAAAIEEQGGSASTWLASARSRQVAERLAAGSRDAVDAEYRAVIREAARPAVAGSTADQRRALRRLRGELRRIDARNYFGAPLATAARDAVERLADGGVGVDDRTSHRHGAGAGAGPRSRRSGLSVSR